MDNQEKENLIRDQYGYVVLESGPVDPDKPAFDSLLGALKDAYYGNCGMDVLVKYHKELSKQLEQSRHSIKKMDEETPEEYKDIVKDQHSMSLGAIDIVQSTLDLLDKYINSPTKDNMATCVESLLNSQRIMKGVHDLLDENIRVGEKVQPGAQEDKSDPLDFSL
jgi:hypothetical protein